MIDTEILHSDQGLLSIGQSGERQFGKKNFMELFSVFLSPPLIKVFYGKQEIGEVHQTTFIIKEDAPSVLTLGGRSPENSSTQPLPRLCLVRRVRSYRIT